MLDLLVGLGETAHQLVGDSAVDEEPAKTGASLAGGADRREQGAPDREIDVGVIHHDHGVVATELEDRPAHALGDGRADDASHVAGPGG